MAGRHRGRGRYRDDVGGGVDGLNRVRSQFGFDLNIAALTHRAPITVNFDFGFDQSSSPVLVMKDLGAVDFQFGHDQESELLLTKYLTPGPMQFGYDIHASLVPLHELWPDPMQFGRDQENIVSLKRFIAVDFFLGYDMTALVNELPTEQIVVSFDFGFDQSADLEKTKDLGAVAFDFGYDMAASRKRYLEATMAFGFAQTNVLNKVRLLGSVAMSFGYDQTNIVTHVAQFSPVTHTYDSGSSNAAMPAGWSTLVVEVWGAGGGGAGAQNSARTGGTAGGASSVSTLGLTANGGVCAGDVPGSASSGGIASGGDTNTTGGSSQAGSSSGAPGSNGNGGASPNGGATTTAPSTTGHGNAAAAPGAGGSGSCQFLPTPGPVYRYAAGASAGGYTKKTYIKGVTVGAPADGSNIAYVVGTKGVGGQSGTPNGTNNFIGGSGANGRVKFACS